VLWSLPLRKDPDMAEITNQVSSTIDALMREFEIITRNLANVNTTGYKRISNAFSKSLEAQKAGEETYSPGRIDLDSALDFSQGNIVETGRPLDFALYGKGFFVIETTEGPQYTRNGVFSTNQNGQIVDSAGRIVAGQAGPISIPASVPLTKLHVSGDGSITADGVAIGKFSLVDFKENENKLVPAGMNCYRMPEQDIQPEAAESAVVKQGYQEASNVKMIDELVDMLMVTRLYEANLKLINAAKEASSSLMSVAMG